jgi:tetratricopeptide (TPR) repeat protein
MNKIEKAKLFRQAGKLRDAIDLLKEHVDEYPADAAVWRLIGDCFHDIKKWKRMLAHWRKARQLGDTDVGLDTAILTHSMRLEHMKKPGAVIEDAECFKQNQEGVLLINQNRFTEAVELFEKVTKEYPQFSGPWVNLGLAHYNLKHFDESITCYRKALDIEPTALTFFNLGTSYIKLEKWEKAITALKRAVDLDSEDADIWFNLGYAFYHCQRYVQALPCLVEALEIYPSYGNVQYHVALCYSALKEKDKTLQALKKVLHMQPKWKEFVKDAKEFEWLHTEDLFKELTT